MDDYISKQAAINACLGLTTYKTRRELVERVDSSIADENGWLGGIAECMDEIDDLPSADVVNKTDLLGWLLAYHTKSFELKGRYFPHEVIAWLVNDLSMYLFEDGEQNETD